MRHQLVLAAVAATVFFVQLGGAHLWDVDEAIFSQTAREMYDRGDAVVPWFNGQLFAHKPPLLYWLQMAAYEMLGANEWAARLPSALFAVGSVLVTYRLGCLVFSPVAGFWAALILATNVSFAVIARAATPDSLLVFFSTLAIYVFVAGTAKARVASGQYNERNAPWAGQTRFEPTWATWTLTYAAMGCGVLV
jgi:4-amino-4-deoxy-L-arabinose transferase-like glycosyltransferase